MLNHLPFGLFGRVVLVDGHRLGGRRVRRGAQLQYDAGRRRAARPRSGRIGWLLAQGRTAPGELVLPDRGKVLLEWGGVEEGKGGAKVSFDRFPFLFSDAP